MKRKKKIKCVVWDLDNTIWDGTLLESSQVILKDHVIRIIKELDKRGILHSICSKNDFSQAMEKLKELRINDLFIYPEINWDSKSSSIKRIAQQINIGLDAMAFVDDQEFELAEVRYNTTEVLCLPADRITGILEMNEMKPHFVTSDSINRRRMYREEMKRKACEEEFSGSNEEFLKTLKMVLRISKVKEGDLERAEELTVRTNQLNSTGTVYSYEKLKRIGADNAYKLFIVELKDKFGDYGKIGLILLECNSEIWTIRMFLMSCRVMSRGIGSALLNYILNLAKNNNVRLQADFIESGRNRQMYVTYKFANFYEKNAAGKNILLENDLSHIQENPSYLLIKDLTGLNPQELPSLDG